MALQHGPRPQAAAAAAPRAAGASQQPRVRLAACRRRFTVAVRAASGGASGGAPAAGGRTAALRALLAAPGILRGPCCHDALSARLIEQSGLFQFAFMSGFCTAAARLGAPDTGLISYGEMVDVGRCAPLFF